MTTPNTLLEWALRYVTTFGWHIFPLRPRSKEPFSGIGIHQATTDTEQIRRWWLQYPLANIALHCGPSGIIAIDLDSYKEDYTGDDLLTLMDRQTTTSLTGNGGEHLLYRMPATEHFGNRTGQLPSGIDIRGFDGYIVLPPSLHPTGKRYAWEEGYSPDKMPPQPLPEKLYRLLKAAQPTTSHTVVFSDTLLPKPNLGQWPLSQTILHLLHAPPPPGQRSEADQRVITALLRAGASDDEIRAVFDHYPIGQQGKYAEKGRAAAQYLAHSIARARQYLARPQPEHLTDLGNALRLVKQHGRDVRYCPAWRRWLVWDGQRWALDNTGEIMRRAKATVQALFAEAAQMADEEQRADVSKWALKSEACARLKAMIELAQSEPGMVVTPQQLDVNPWLLNVQNGTIDLKTGALRPHRREDLITKLAPVAYDPMATCPAWLTFLDRILHGSPVLVAFLQRIFGYALTGDTSEQALFFCYGTGANGKSTLLETWRTMLGSEYVQQTPMDTLLVKERGGGIPNDLARLQGARTVLAVEADAGRKLSEALVKQVTGGDRLAVRFLYGEFFELRPAFKLFVAANHKPIIRGTDYAMWRRIHLIPFTVTILPEEQDKHLGEKLSAERAGILAWAVRGCLAWQAAGLAVPAEVQAATQHYREEMDTLGSFLHEQCVVQPTAQVLSAELYHAYTTWCDRMGEHPLSQKRLGTHLEERGFTRIRFGATGARGWCGLGVRTETAVN